MEVHEIRRNPHARYIYLLAIEGVREMYATHPAIAGSGPGSWIGEQWGDRVVKPGLMVPASLPCGRLDERTPNIEEAGGTFGLIDLDGTVAEVMRSQYPDQQTDSLGVRLSPLEDPAPETVVGIGQTPVPIRGRHVGLEAIGPNGERRYYWLAPDDVPPGLDHPSGPGWPLAPITPGPIHWAGRKLALYQIVWDPDSQTWLDWGAQYAGGSMIWYGTSRDYGTWKVDKKHGQMLQLHCAGPASWLRKSINLNRKAKWYRPTPSIQLSGVQGADNTRIAVWIERWPGPEWTDDGPVYSTYAANVFHSDNTLEGLTSPDEIAGRINAVIQTMISDDDYGGVSAATNTEPLDLGGYWQQQHTTERGAKISATGSSVQIRREKLGEGESGEAFALMLCLHVDVWAALGYSVSDQLNYEYTSSKRIRFTPVDGPTYNGSVRVGGLGWTGPEGQNVAPGHGYYVGAFSTIPLGEDPPPWKWDNGGDWRLYQRVWDMGTITLDPTRAGQIVRLALGRIPCEGQLAQRYKKSAKIDDKHCNANGWWVFKGPLLREGDEEPREFMAIALCSWVTGDDRAYIEVDDYEHAAIRIDRWENPRLFGIDEQSFDFAWTVEANRLECAPIGVLGGLIPDEPDYVLGLLRRTLLSSGTARHIEVLDGVITKAGKNQPADALYVWAGDTETSDFGLGLAPVFVDVPSFDDAAKALPGGQDGPLNRGFYPVFGSDRLNLYLREMLAGRGLTWSWKRGGERRAPQFGVMNTTGALGHEDAEVILDERSMAAKTADAVDEWAPVVETREEGPYDRFPIEFSRNPITREMSGSHQFDSLDPGRHTRSGVISWPISDGGLRSSAWFSPLQTTAHNWQALAQTRFASEKGGFHGRRNFVVTVKISPTHTPDVGLGTVVWYRNPRAPNPAGGYGLDHFGRVIELTLHLAGDMAGWSTARIWLHPKSAAEVRYWAPAAYGDHYDDQTGVIQCSRDWARTNKPEHSDTYGFVEPPWSETGGGPARVRICQSETGTDWPKDLYVWADVVAADHENHTLTLTNPTGKIYRDMLKWVFLARWDMHPASHWVRSLYVPITRADGTHGNPPQKGYRL